MNSVLARLRGGFGRTRTGANRPAPDEGALGRLRMARESFDDSVVALRKAALDHVDVQDLASTAIRANLDRLALSLARDPVAGDLHRVLGGDRAGDG